MKRMILMAAMLTALMVAPPSVRAADQQPPVTTQTTATAQPKRVSFFSKLMELERRKNAAILRMLGWKK